MRALDELIADSPVFAGLAPAQLQLIAGCARNEHVEAGTLLFREGEARGSVLPDPSRRGGARDRRARGAARS